MLACSLKQNQHNWQRQRISSAGQCYSTSRKRNQKVNKAGHLRRPSTTYLLIQVARASTSVVATQQSRWIEFMTIYFPMGYFCKDFSYLQTQLICFMVGNFISELCCKLLRLYNTKGCWNFTVMNRLNVELMSSELLQNSCVIYGSISFSSLCFLCFLYMQSHVCSIIFVAEKKNSIEFV